MWSFTVRVNKKKSRHERDADVAESGVNLERNNIKVFGIIKRESILAGIYSKCCICLIQKMGI